MVDRNRADAPLAVEVASALLVPAGVFGFIRVFESGSDILPVVGACLMSTALSVALRRLRVPLLAAAIVSVAALAVLIINRYAPGTARLGIIPTGETRDAFDLLVDDGFAS